MVKELAARAAGNVNSLCYMCARLNFPRTFATNENYRLAARLAGHSCRPLTVTASSFQEGERARERKEERVRERERDFFFSYFR